MGGGGLIRFFLVELLNAKARAVYQLKAVSRLVASRNGLTELYPVCTAVRARKRDL